MEKTTNIIDLIYLAKKNGVDIVLNEEQLQLKVPKNVDIDQSLLAEIKNNKQLIIDFLRNENWKSTTVDENHNKINKFNRNIGHIPLSFSQKRLWFIDQLEGSVQYHIPIVRRLKGKLNKEALANALLSIATRHEVLRTVILEQEGEPYQFVMNSGGWRLELIDGSSYVHGHEGLQEQIQDLIRKPFNLAKDYMVRAHLISLIDEEYVLIVTMHHIASDGWSMSIFVNELIEFYNAYVEQRPQGLEPLAIQYADYSLWQRNYLQDEVLDEKVGYWKDKLKGIGVLQLPTDYQRPAEWSSRGALLRFNIDKLLSDQLLALSRQEGTTLFMTVLATFKVLLHRYSGQEDICVGTPIANRTQKEVEGLIGFFVNTLALRSDVKSGLTFEELLQQVKGTTMGAYEHLDVPFEKIVEEVVKERDISRNPLFQVMLIMQNTPRSQALHLGEVKLSPEEFIHNTAHFDITFSIAETPKGLEGAVEYATDLYDEETIKRMVGHFSRLLDSIVKNPQQKISGLKMLTEEEEEQLLYEFNNTAVEYPKDKTVVDLFEDQATKTPAAIAVVFEGEQFSYKQLNEKANQLAHYLRSRGIKKETIVPICIERSLEMIVGILGILKSGGAYIPIDPEYPEERIKFMLKDSKAKMVVSSSSGSKKLSLAKDIAIIELDSQWVYINEQPTDNLPAQATADNLAYVIYTSGSTGNPKGVMIENRSLINLLKSVAKEVDFKGTSSILSVTTYSFDICYLEFYMPLITGGKLIIVSREVSMDGFKLADTISYHLPTHMQATPSTWQILLDTGWQNKEAVRILIGGEAVKESLKDKLAINGDVFNLYGPTETTIWSAIKKLELNEKVVIGKPIANTTILVLSKSELLPIGVTGEICIGGDGLARGYLNRPELTQEKFIKNPFNKKNGARIYKTGDLGRWLANGNLEYLGRVDDQVKIRGYRIELGEIETVLHKCQGVNGGVVLAREDRSGSMQLVGYVVPETNLDKEAIMNELRKKLPEFMVPALWVEVKNLPLTPNGKIDKKSLPDFDVMSVMNDNYVAPRNETEKMIAQIWQEVLDVEQVGMKNNFFELGGHSLVILKLASKIRELGLKIEVKDFFKYQTIEQQSNFIKTSLKLLQTASEGKFVIPIQPEGNNIPLFAIPEFLLYSEMGKHISKNQPFYSIEHSPSPTISEVVNHYITEIKKTYPSSPYALMGYCDDGKIILEIAQTLIAQGDQVPVLVLIEYYSSAIKLSKSSLKFIGGKTKFIISQLLQNVSFANKKKFLYKQFRHALKFINHKSISSGKKTSASADKTYTGKVILIQASQTYGYKDDPHMGWSEIFTGEVKKFIIKGEHIDIMVSPSAASQIAEILNRELICKNSKKIAIENYPAI